MTCQEMIDKIASGEIREIKFRISGYNHYRNCSIRNETETFTFRGETHQRPLTEIKLTNDNSERFKFYGKIKDYERLFRIKGVNYTLPEVWNRIEIIQIVWDDGSTTEEGNGGNHVQ